MNDHTRIQPPGCRIAVLVDGESIATALAEDILHKAGEFGSPEVRRVYGRLDDARFRGWSAMPDFRLMAASGSRTSTDTLLSIDAMELALDKRVEAIVIAASDHDYSPVALRLRERGFPVFGLIEPARPAAALRAVYAGVRHLAGVAEPVRVPAGVVVRAGKALPELSPDSTILRLIERNAEMNGSITLIRLGQLLLEAGLRPRTTGSATWTSYFRKHPEIYRLEGNAHEARVFTAEMA